ncbi:hypothetical protein ACFLSQ_08955 [Bacteroidota bacterium]
MRKINRILIWENTRRINKLIEFNNDIIEYFDKGEQPSVRRKINQGLHEIIDILESVNLHPAVKWSPPRAMGGATELIDIFLNIFHLHHYMISSKWVVDPLDQAIGIYKKNAFKSKINIINPFFYLSFLTDFIVSIPFRILQQFGINREKTEDTVVGKIIAGIFRLVAIIFYLVMILQAIDYLDQTMNFIIDFFSRKAP